MERPLLIGIIGDRQPDNPTHLATDAGLLHAATARCAPIEVRWLETSAISENDALPMYLGFFCAPGSPYRDMQGALRAIRFARENDVPFMGTCGGFQHAVIEFARNVAGIVDAQHEEYDAEPGVMVVSALACSLVGQKLSITIDEGTRARALYGVGCVEEDHYCSFGLNPAHRDALVDAGLYISARGDDGEPRIVELNESRFHLATLFVPQGVSTPEKPHPLLTGFIDAAVEHCAARGTA